jgi:nicotinate-nucleotide adenylyltransferase
VKKLALLGGSFDPPHLGHLLLAASALWSLEPDELWLVPVYRHPFAKSLAPFEDRVAMTRLAAAPFGSQVRVSLIEETLAATGGKGTSVELLRHLRGDDPQRSLLWVMGADLAAETHRWADFDEVQRLSTVVWFNRQGHPSLPHGGPALPDVSATEVRDRARAGSGLEGLVPAAVARYIEQRKLYAA